VSAPPFALAYADEALRVLDDLTKPATPRSSREPRRHCGCSATSAPATRTELHKYQSLTGPNGEDVWESYIENRTPGASRIWWLYGPTPDTLTILTLGPHP